MSKIHSIDLFVGEKKYYIFGDKNNHACPKKCDQINKQPIGSDCIEFDALLSNWLIYNNEYNIPTHVYFNTDNQQLINHFKCYQGDKCPYYPNVNIRIFDQLDTNINLSFLNKLMNYYYSITDFFTKGKSIFFKELSNKDIIQYGYTYVHFMNQLIEKYRIDYAELYLIYNQTGQLDTKKFIDYYINILKNLHQFLNNLEILENMLMQEDKILMVVTNQPEHFSLFLKNYTKHEYSLSNEQNCVSIEPKQIYADEYRLYRFRNMKTSDTMHLVKIKDFDTKIKLQRSGVIPYTYIDNELYFLFGVDKEYHEWTDFGGKIEKYENALTAALRELKEESLVLNLSLKDIQEGLIVYDDKMAILFVYIPYNPKMINDFKKKLTKKSEVDGIIWLSLEDLKKELYQDKIYTRVKHHLLKAKNFYDLL